MKIAMIGQKSIPSRSGGIEVHVEEIAKRLAAMGCEVEAYSRKGYHSPVPPGGTYEGIRIKYAPYLPSRSFEAITHTFFATIKALCSKCDIFHYHALGPSIMSFLPRLFRKKVVCTIHGLDWQRGKWGGFASRVLKFGEFMTARCSNATISVSRNLVDYYQNKYQKTIHYIPNGVEEPVLREPELIREKFGLGKDGYILFVARLVPEKGAHYLIDAFKQIKTDKKLVIAGASSFTDNYVEELHRMAQPDPRILFTGFVQGSMLEELYSNAYLYVLPSDIEGQPLSLLEALSYGNCCLTSDIPENTAVLDGNGHTFKKADVADLAGKLSELMLDEHKKEHCRNGTKDLVLASHNWESISKTTYELYESLLKVGVECEESITH